MSLILAIDQSTSATKAVLFDAMGKVLDRASRKHQQFYPQPGWVEHDANEIWNNVLEVIGEIAGRQAAILPRLACISITNQRETVLVFDRTTGKPLHHAIVWQCRRGDLICRRLRERDNEKLVLERTGLKIDTYFSASKVKWLVAAQPEIAARLGSGEAVIGTIDTFLIHRLTGGHIFATDFTNASRTLLFDIDKLRWDEQLCSLFDVPLSALPEVRESGAKFGETEANGLLPKPVPIRGVMGDSQASLFAQRCYEPGMAKATFGTGTSILFNIGHEFRASEQSAVTALAWVLNGRPTYAFEGLISFSAATIEWLKNQLQLIDSAAEVQGLARAVLDNGGVYLVPAFAGLSAPYWSPDARGAIVGMTAHTRKEHVVRAALESIAYQIQDVLVSMRDGAAVKLSRLDADGGPTENDFLMQFTADITGVELRVSKLSEASAWGAAMNGLLGLGVYKSLDELALLPREDKHFRPKMADNLVVQNYSGWKEAVKRVL